MKYIMLLLILFSGLVSGQDFAPIGARWHYDSSMDGTRPIYGAYRLYEVVGDTMVSGKACKVIRQSLNSNNGSQALSDVFVYEQNDTVFYYNGRLQKFSALYIFNAEPGDTLTFDTPNDFPPRFASQLTWRVVVDSIVPVTYGNETLRSFYTSPIVTNDTSLSFYSFHRPYVEKLGGTFLFLHQPYVIFPGWDGPLRCYGDSLRSINLLGIRCDSVTGTGIEQKSPLDQIRFFPNPVMTELIIESGVQKEVFYGLYDLSGRLLTEGRLENGRQTIDLHLWANGLYVIRFYASGFHRMERLVIAK